MRWPADHPVRTDVRLAEWRDDADAVCPGGHAVELLRYVPSRRATTLVETSDGPAVLKLYASPRARGNHRRLCALRPAMGSLVPRPLAVGPAGHAGLLEYVPGRPLRLLSGADFVACCEELGRSLADLQACGVRMDREWTAVREVDALSHRLASGGRPWSPPPAAGPPVPAHRDLHPAQVVVARDAVHLIDLDEAAMAPAGLDVGNFLAHLDRDAALGERSCDEAEAGARAFLRGYGEDPPALAWWRRITLARLACLEEERHGRPDMAVRLRALVD